MKHRVQLLALAVVLIAGCGPRSNGSLPTSHELSRESRSPTVVASQQVSRSDPQPGARGEAEVPEATVPSAPAGTQSPRRPLPSSAPEVNRPLTGTPGSRYESAYPQPEPPKPDVVVGTLLERNGAKVTLVAIAKITEEAITCWMPDGSPAPDTQKMLEEYLGRGAGQQRLGSSLGAVIYGKKNRIAILRIEQATEDQRGFQIVGSAAYQGMVGMTMHDLSWSGRMMSSGPSSASPGPNQTRLIGLPLIAERSATSAPLLVQAMEPPQSPPTFNLEVGATVQCKGGEFTVQSIGAASSKVEQSFQSRFKWQVEMSAKGSGNLPSMMHVQPLDSKADVIARMKSTGEPVTQKEYNQLTQDFYKSLQSPPSTGARPEPPRFDLVQIQRDFAGPRDNSRVRILMNINPKYVSKLRVNEINQIVIEFKDVLLDPK